MSSCNTRDAVALRMRMAAMCFALFALAVSIGGFFAVPDAEAAVSHRVPVDQNGKLCVTGEFGEMYDNGPHKGMDIAPYNAYARQSFNVYASAPGKVVVSTYSDSWGNYVKLEHADGTHTLYAHLSARNVVAGQTVSQGQVLGIMGETGYAFGKHLHFEYYKDGVRCDPRLIINIPRYLVAITKSNSSSGTANQVYTVTPASGNEEGVESDVWRRLAGESQFDTMERIVGQGWAKGFGGTVVVATSNGYWDALSAAGVAGLSGSPVLITNRWSLQGQTASELARLSPSRIVVVGGRNAVSDEVLKQIEDVTGVVPTRTFGTTMTDTAAAINETYFGKRSTTAILATSRGFYDALSAAPLSYALHYPIFLAENAYSVSDATLSAMKECGIKQVIVVGGTAVVSDDLVGELARNGIALKKRLAGWDYYDTSREIAAWALGQGMSANRLGVATSYDYYDALCGAALCGKYKSVLLLADARNAENVDSGSVSFTRSHKSSIKKGFVFGGTKAVSTDTFKKIVSSTS